MSNLSLFVTDRSLSAVRFMRTVACAVAAMAAIPVSAEPVYQPPGTNLTYGSVTHGHRIHSTTGNPAAAAAKLHRGGGKSASGTVISVTAGIEYGNIDKIFDVIDDSADAFEPTDPGDTDPDTDPVPVNPKQPIDIGTIIDTQFPDFDQVVDRISEEVANRAAILALIAAEGHAKVFDSADAPFVIGREVIGGTWTFGANWSGTAKALGLARPIAFDANRVREDLSNSWDPTIPVDNLPRLYDVPGDVNIFVDQATGNYGINFANDSSMLIKSATTLELSLGYSWHARKFAQGDLFLGVEGKYYDLSLSRVSFRFGDITDSQELFDSIRDNEFEDDQGFGLDLGVLWVGSGYRLGATVTNVNQPKFEYPSVDLSTYSDSEIIRLLENDRIYIKERQLKLEASFFSPNGRWTFNLGLDANDLEDPVGDEFQWFTASAGYATDSWWLPGVRFGYRENLVGTELSYLGVGVTAFRVVNIDLASAFDTVEIDGEDLPQGLLVSIGVDISF